METRQLTSLKLSSREPEREKQTNERGLRVACNPNWTQVAPEVVLDRL